MPSTTDKLSRRQWAALAGALAAGAPANAQVSAQVPAPAASPGSRDYLAEQRTSILQDAEQLRGVDLDYSDEPIFALVVK